MLDLPGLHPDLPSAMQGNMTRAEIDASIAQVKDFGFEESPETIEVLLKYNKYDVQSAMEVSSLPTCLLESAPIQAPPPSSAID